MTGSRGRLDLDEDTASPRSSRWLGVPSYLHPTSFHSHSSASESSHVQHQSPALVAEEPRYGLPNDTSAGVTPFVPGQRAAESEKARSRRQSISLRVTNDPRGAGEMTEDGHEGVVTTPPQPALLARARTMSTGRNPASPRPPMLNAQSRSNSQANSHSTSNLHGHTDSPGSSSRQYQEDDAGVSLVIENGESEPIRSVPPAYVDYRSSTHELLGRQGSGSGTTGAGSSSREGAGYTSGSGSGSGMEGSRGSEGVASGSGTGASTSTAVTESEDGNVGGKKEVTEQEQEQNDVDTVDARSTTDANTLRETGTLNTDGHDERDRTTSADSEGASTIKATESVGEEAPQPVTRSSTTDLAALTAANTAANRSAGPSTPVERPAPVERQSAPVIAITTPEGHEGDDESAGHAGGAGAGRAGNTPPSTDQGHSPTPSTWSWSRAMGVLGMNSSGSGSNPPKA